MFHDIFSKKEQKEKIINYENIIIDIHEKNSLIPSILSKLSIPFKFESLNVADYLVNNIAIERKTFSDLQSSIMSKRIFYQLKNLKQYEKSLLVIEKNLTDKKILHENSIRSFILKTCLDLKIPIIFTDNQEDSAKYLSLVARKNPIQTISSRAKKTTLSKKEQILFVLEGFPSIGPKKAKNLLKKFKSIKNIINAQKKDIEDILGKGSQDFINLISLNPYL
jgi:ERCC4-type nuclease